MMKNHSDTKYYLIVIVLFTTLIAMITASWYLSSQIAPQSNSESMTIARYVLIYLNDHSVISKYSSWLSALNDLIRKVAHLIVYGIIGLVMCSLLNITLRRASWSALLSIITSFLLGFVDEFHQQFVPGRGPSLFDVGVDTVGAVAGIILVTVFFVLYNHIKSLKKRITELEKEK